jgi:hypothetical protein
MSAEQLFRRKTVAALAATAACALAGSSPAIAEPIFEGPKKDCAGPTFSNRSRPVCIAINGQVYHWAIDWDRDL